MDLHTSSRKAFASITEYLAWDHREIMKILADLGSIVEDAEIERAESTFAELRARLDRHIRIEEEALFPRFEASMGRITRGPTFPMGLEHIEILKIAEDMGQAITAGQGTLFAEERAELEGLLAKHSAWEEGAFAPRMDRLAGDQVPSLVDWLERQP